MKHIKIILGIILLTFSFSGKAQEHACRHKHKANGQMKVLPTRVQSQYDVKWYFLNLQMSDRTIVLSGDATMRAQVQSMVMDTFSFHLDTVLMIDSIKVNGVKKSFISSQSERLVTGLSLPQNEIFDVQVFYRGTPNTENKMVTGITSKKDNRFNTYVTWTLSEPNNAFQWFPVKQDLKDKADSAWIFITVDDTLKAGSNGLLTNITNLGNGKVRYEWKTFYPIDYYLISVAISNYQDYSIYAKLPNSNDSVLIQNYIYNYQNCLNTFKKNIDTVSAMITYFSEIFGKYPFFKEKYGHCLAPMGGGMEHQTMTTLQTFDQGLTAHELAHQWFGDNVTCASWQDVWLNEGFATYSEVLWGYYAGGTMRGKYILNIDLNFVLNNAKTGSVYVPFEDIDNEDRIFDVNLTYRKGAYLVHMLRYEVNEDSLLFKAFQKYQQDYAFSTASVSNLKNVLQDVTGKNFDIFFDQWYYGEGYPVFDVNWAVDGDSMTLNIVQTTTSEVTPLFKTHIDWEIKYTDSSRVINRLYIDENEMTIKVPVDRNKTIKSCTLDPDKWIIMRMVDDTIYTENRAFQRADIVKISPNPVNDKMIVDCSKIPGNKTIAIQDAMGRNMQVIACNHNECELNIAGYNSGIYFVKIICREDIFVKKIIKR